MFYKSKIHFKTLTHISISTVATSYFKKFSELLMFIDHVDNVFITYPINPGEFYQPSGTIFSTKNIF